MSSAVKTVLVVVAVAVVAVAVWLIRPLFVDTEVDEAFPASAASEGDDAFPLSAEAEVPDDMTQEEVEAEMATAAAEPPVEQVEDMPDDQPTALVTGSFEGADNFHMGEGTATLYELGDGSRVLRFEDFSVTNGPDLRVYIGPVGPTGTAIITSQAVQLGTLKGNVGNQNYDVGDDFDVDQDLGVIIYCEPFRVVFATAVLS
ncbi:MAG: DM13 domain-containing protein [Euzebya sp.]